jgi:choline transporter-like protein 2/4/5
MLKQVQISGMTNPFVYTRKISYEQKKMGCCGKKETDGEEDPHGGDDFIEGGKRRCTDVLFLLIFVCFWVGMLAVGGYGFANGDPALLVMGTDYEGVLCNEKGTGIAGTGSNNTVDNTGLKVRYWANFLEVLAVAQSSLISAATISSTFSSSTYTLADAKSMCIDSCPQPNTDGTVKWFCDYPESGNYEASLTKDAWTLANGDVFTFLTASEKLSSYALQGPCYPVLIPTVNTYFSCNYYGNFSQASFDAFVTMGGTNFYSDSSYSSFSTVTDMVESINSEVTSYIAGPMERFQRYIDDFVTAKNVLGAAAGISIAFSLIWLIVLRYFTTLFCWGTVFGVNLGSIAVTLYLALKSGLIGSDQVSSIIDKTGVDSTAVTSSSFLDPSSENEEVLKICTYIMAAFTCIFFIFTLLMIRRLKVAVACIKVSISAFAAVPSLIFFPLIPCIAMLLLFLYWVFAGVYLMSCGDQKLQTCVHPFPSSEAHGCGVETEWSRELQYMLLYHFFGFLWGSQFIIAISYLCVAYVFAKFYWSGADKMGLAPLLVAMKRMPFYHSGSAAFGSFLIAVMQFIRICMRVIMHGLKKIGRDSKLWSVLGYLIECCLWCCQKVIEFINRNAYIMIVIDGNSFCWSAFQALKLLIANVLSVAAINIVGDLLLFLAKLSVSLGCAFLAFVMLNTDEYTQGDNAISSPVLICSVIAIFSYSIAAVFMGIVEMGIDTTLLSYCRDMEKHGGVPQYAPETLQKALGIAGEVQKAEEDRKAQRAAQKAAKASA